MSKTNIITGLDIGTGKIKFLVANYKNENLELLSKTEEESDGVRRGVVIEGERVSQIIKNNFLKIREEVNQKINSTYVNLDGSHLFSAPSRGLVSVSRADQKISEEDIQRVLQAAQAINLSANQEIFDALPIDFIVDGEKGIKEPLGLKGIRLEVDILALGGFAPFLENLKQTVFDSDLEISGIIPSPVAAAQAVLTEKQKELGVGLLDIGAGTTGLAVFEKGDLVHLAILPIGSANITNDIAIALKTDIDVAERIKIEFGSCLYKGKDIKQKIDAGEEEPIVFSRKFLSKIITDRVSEIFEEANKELKKISREKLLPAGVVLTGGGAKMPKMVDLAKNKFRLHSSLGRPKGISGIEDDLSWATAAGLILLGADSTEGEKKFGSGEGFLTKMKKIFRIFIP